MPQNFHYQDGQLLLAPSDEIELLAMLQSTFRTKDLDGMKAFGGLITEPISTIATYEEWANRLFVNKTVQPNEDWAIPLEEYNLTAFFSSPDGRIRRTRAGLLNVRPDFSTIRSGFEIGWDDLENATWNIVGNKIMRTGQEIARKRDALAYGVLQTAVNNVGHVVNTTGGVLTRSSVDAIFKQAAAIGFPIKRVVGNPATLMDMRSAQFFTWDSNKVPLAYGDSAMVKQIMTQGYVGDYGGAEWFSSLGLSSGTTLGTSGTNLAAVTAGQAVLWYVSDATTLGFNVQRGSTRQMSEVKIDTRTNVHTFDETRFFYVANGYAVWQQIISS